MEQIREYLGGVKREIAQTTFPSREKTIYFTIFVIIFSAIFSAYFAALDLSFGEAVLRMIDNFRGGTNAAAVSSTTTPIIDATTSAATTTK